MKDITETLGAGLKKQCIEAAKTTFDYREEVIPFFILPSRFDWCKEEFMYRYRDSRFNTDTVIFSGFNYTEPVSIARLAKIQEIFSFIENLIKVPANKRTTFSYVSLEHECSEYDDFDDEYESHDLYFTGLVLNESSFWLTSLVTMELFCCLYKSVIQWQPKKICKKSLIAQLENEEYFSEDGMIWALFNIPAVQEMANTTHKEGEKKWLYNFNCSGIVDAIIRLRFSLDKSEYNGILNYEPA